MKIVLADRKIFTEYIHQFSALYQKCFNEYMSEEEIDWRYLQNPNGDVLACFAFEDGQLIANYSASPIRLIYGDRIAKAALSLNTMTDPDYAGQGLFVKTASHLYEYLAHNGYICIMGFPNYISNRTFVSKLGWKDIYEIPTLTLDLHTYSKDVEYPKGVIRDDNFQMNHNNCFYENCIQVYKDQKYLQWRYSDSKRADYKVFVTQTNGIVNGRIILKEYKNYLNIVDKYFSDTVAFDALIRTAICYGLETGKEKLTVWDKLGSNTHLQFEKNGFRNQYPITYFGACMFCDKTDLPIQEYDRWQLNLSDDNVY